MRNVWFDRSAADRRSGVRRAAVAAWAIVFVLGALVLAVPGGAAPGRPAGEHVIAGLIAHPVAPASDSCQCNGDYDGLETAPAPSMC